MTIRQKQWQLYFLGYYSGQIDGIWGKESNSNVGGAANSRHPTGKAVDLRIEGKSARQTLALALKQPELRYAYAIDGNYVHMDIE